MMQEYLVRVKGIVESLISTGETVSEGILIDYILGGLGSEYHCVFTTVKSRGKTSFEELTDILISVENILKRMNNDTQVIAMSPHTTPFRGYGRGRSNYYQPRPYYNQPSYPHQQNAPIYPHQQFRGSNPNYYQPRPYLNQPPYFSPEPYQQQNPYNYYQPPPQFQPSLARPISTAQLPPLISTPPSLDQSQSCQICDKKGHLAKQCPEISNFAAFTTTLAPV